MECRNNEIITAASERDQKRFISLLKDRNETPIYQTQPIAMQADSKYKSYQTIPVPYKHSFISVHQVHMNLIFSLKNGS